MSTFASLPLAAQSPRAASDAAAAASDARSAASDAPRSARRWALPAGLTRAQTVTAAAIVGAALALAGIGLYLSFEHVAVFAHERLGFATLGKARLFTVGVDVGILVLIALDLLMAWLRRPIGWVRFPVWLLTGATLVLNAASAAPTAGAWTTVDYVAAFAHGIVPVLFIAVVEIGKTAIDRVVRQAAPAEGVPLHRWFLSPVPTFTLWRRMKLWAVGSYAAAVERDKELRVYRVMLERQHGSVRKAPSDARLPLTMARYGLSVDEALALPQEAEAREQARLEAEEDTRAAEEKRRAERTAQAEIARLRAAGDVQSARAQVSAATSRAEVEAAAAVAAAERAKGESEGGDQRLANAFMRQRLAKEMIDQRWTTGRKQPAHETRDDAEADKTRATRPKLPPPRPKPSAARPPPTPNERPPNRPPPKPAGTRPKLTGPKPKPAATRPKPSAAWSKPRTN
ncbi:DUF2637 domain-containing protein [Streptomyces sp. S399]|uniref:DUF2637 domain-containing protein n=1 Tax=Streptomyces sp. S399 TaxID=3096009 RepID=UPI002A808379|nr:DUF2637 domain-containing protein [Streptomyces sp. S399]WPR52693.1 DUF2637 domain-containing protein [Streptomyces sp. S399]